MTGESFSLKAALIVPCDLFCAPAAQCPEGSTGDVPTGCTVLAGYGGTVTAISEHPYYKVTNGGLNETALLGSLRASCDCHCFEQCVVCVGVCERVRGSLAQCARVAHGSSLACSRNLFLCLWLVCSGSVLIRQWSRPCWRGMDWMQQLGRLLRQHHCDHDSTLLEWRFLTGAMS